MKSAAIASACSDINFLATGDNLPAGRASDHPTGAADRHKNPTGVSTLISASHILTSRRYVRGVTSHITLVVLVNIFHESGR